ncbi:MAG: PepSY-associated TM helix domain-containing protein, partial [Dysgonamonadaceae bacterium]|nr:PepSY-associated TM helix domain-containing protein [Dysgonamonadaceae bacterium]
PYNESGNYTKHYFPNDNSMKVFLKGGSSLEVDLTDGSALYERVRKRPIISQMNWLHYNPHKWWTLFSDIFAFGLIIITLTGLFITRGKKGLLGRGGIELIIGILIPLGFIFFF